MKSERIKSHLAVVSPETLPSNNIPHYMLVGFCLSAAMSLFLSKVFFIAFLISWLYQGITKKLDLKALSPTSKKYVQLSGLWLALCLSAAILGVDFTSALTETLKTFMYLLFPLAVFQYLDQTSENKSALEKRCSSYLWLLLIGQTATSLHTILFSKSAFLIGLRPPGAVTESGQLALVIPATLALIVLAAKKHEPTKLTFGGIIAFGTLVGVAILFGHWSPLFLDNQRYGFLTLALGCALLGILSLSGRSSETLSKLLKLSICMVFLVTALLINLKRGPWMGLSFSLIIIGLMQSRRELLASVFSLILVVLMLSPTNERIVESGKHFSTAGGRAEMWKVGFEITRVHPIGLGLDNAKYMRTVNPFLPETHKHMHNNFINVLVESGWLGLIIFSMWTLLPIQAALTRRERSPTLLIHLAAALAAWNVAGLVEYNFGDSEVRMIALLFMGLVFANSEPTSSH